MDIKFKTLDKQRFTMSVDPQDQVEDLIFGLENIIGRENLYRLIYAGKLLKEGTPPLQQKVDNAQIEEMEMIRSKKFPETKDDKWLRTESEDAGYESEEDMPTNFVTEKEFSVALDVVMKCENLFDQHKTPLTQEEMVAYINTKLDDVEIGSDDVESNFKDMILGEIDLLLKRRPNKKQISAFLVDIQGMFNETRDIRNSMGGKIVDIDFGNEQSGEITKMEESHFGKDEKENIQSSNNIKRVNQIPSKLSAFQEDPLYFPPAHKNLLSFLHGNEEFQFLSLVQESHFGKEEKEKIKSSNNITWVNQIPSKLSAFQEYPLYFPPADKNFLSFLHGNEEFQFLSLVLQDPSELQPLLVRFGQSHTDLMNLVFGNKKNFGKMLLDEKQKCEN